VPGHLARPTLRAGAGWPTLEMPPALLNGLSLRRPDGTAPILRQPLDANRLPVRRCRTMRIPPPVLALCAGAAQQSLTRGAGRPTARRAAAAVAIALASGSLAEGSARRFRHAGTTLNPIDPTQASVLVTTGPNAITRNPMYVGLAGLLVANALRLGSWTALAPVAAFVLVIDRLQIASEEAALLAHFGAEYDEYRAAVPRWVGRRSVRQ